MVNELITVVLIFVYSSAVRQKDSYTSMTMCFDSLKGFYALNA